MLYLSGIFSIWLSTLTILKVGVKSTPLTGNLVKHQSHCGNRPSAQVMQRTSHPQGLQDFIESKSFVVSPRIIYSLIHIQLVKVIGSDLAGVHLCLRSYEDIIIRLLNMSFFYL